MFPFSRLSYIMPRRSLLRGNKFYIMIVIYICYINNKKRAIIRCKTINNRNLLFDFVAVYSHLRYTPDWDRTSAHGVGGRCSIH